VRVVLVLLVGAQSGPGDRLEHQRPMQAPVRDEEGREEEKNGERHLVDGIDARHRGTSLRIRKP
jgi:hypothetical protein